jgi:bifunctional non-homologous end joining protein LigD
VVHVVASVAHPLSRTGYDDPVETRVVAGEETMPSTAELAGVEIPRPDKEMFPGASKQDVARYYADVAEVMLPHLAGRPVNMQRFPDGIDGQGFYEKRVPDHFPDWVERVRVGTRDGSQEQVVVGDERTLVYLAAQACLTPHAWLSRTDRLDTPDQMVFDLDPSGDDPDAVRRATRMTGETLADLGLTSFVKTTGSRGYHVVVPLRPADDFDSVRSFARAVASLLQSRDPDLFTTEQRKRKRDERVYVDVMRNAYGQTAVPPYALRARDGAPVATPIEWDELSRVAPDRYTITSLKRRLAQRADPWQDFTRHAQRLDEARRRLPQE